eukprot:TRINITY_DN10717_c0_g1_i2.p1 TRINITY_DN10717_c0_g1~~TRINITY_DN10717_c0_g1_i2.p1  ORF type:complete len:347 (+),score=77.54 TRINITY_DN10717_c0_g1_i2:655-1695(+)
MRVVLCMCAAAAAVGRTPLIIDTDIGGGGCMDVDDVAALAVAHALADKGEVDLMAVVADTAHPEGVAVISAVGVFYGRGVARTAIGAYKGTALSGHLQLPYVAEVAHRFPTEVRNASEAPDAVAVYRTALAAAEDGTVVVASIGLLTNLEALFRSPPDGISPLSGIELARVKMARLAIMGGGYPASGRTPQGCNFCGCAFAVPQADIVAAAGAASYVVAHLPPSLPTVFLGGDVGRGVLAGGRLSTCQPKSSPVRAAFENYEGGPGRPRYAWDPLTTLLAVRGPAAAGLAACSDCAGANTVSGTTGRNAWEPSGAPTNQSYVVLADPAAAGAALDDLLCQPPRPRS